MSTKTAYHQAARELAQLGLNVFPIKPKDKAPPLTERGCLDASSDQEQIRRWWGKTPDANIGIATGAESGVWVLDIDGDDGFHSLNELIKRHGAFPKTVAATTGSGGLHYYFKHPGGRVSNSRRKMPGIDTRGDGGYVVAAPSVHPSGNLYCWNKGCAPGECPFAETPAWLASVFIDQKQREELAEMAPVNGHQPPDGLADRLIGIAVKKSHENKERHPIAVWLAKQLQDNRFDHEEARRIMAAFQSEVANVPWTPRVMPESEVLKLVDHVYQSFEPRVPWKDNGTGANALAAFNLTDDGNGRAIEHLHADRLKFDHTGGRWLIWRESHWRENRDGGAARLAVETIKARGKAAFEADGMKKEQREALAGFALRCENQIKVNAALEATKRQLEITTTGDQWDRDPWLLACPNVTIDLRTGDAREPSPDDRITRCLTVRHAPRATCPRWQQFLFEIFDGDAELVQFVHRAVGYSLTGSTQEQCFLILYGIGKNGKSTFLKVLGLLLGDYACNADFSSFIAQKPHQGAREDLARLVGARFVSAKETNETARLDEGTIKGLTGGDVVTARHLYQPSFEYVPEFKIWLAVNHRPTITGADEGIWRRVRLVPFKRQFDPSLEPDLEDRLRAELPGILRWAVEGCAEWRRQGLGWPKAVKDATGAYRGDMDVVGQFLAECCELHRSGEASSSKLYKAYKEWAERTGEKPLSQRSLSLKIDRALCVACRRVKPIGLSAHGLSGGIWA